LRLVYDCALAQANLVRAKTRVLMPLCVINAALSMIMLPNTRINNEACART